MIYVYFLTGVWYFNMLLYPFSVLTAQLVFLGKQRRRRFFILRIFLAAAFMFVVMLLLPTIIDSVLYQIFYFIVQLSATILVMGFLFDIPLEDLLLYCAAGLCLHQIISCILGMCFFYVQGTGTLLDQLAKAIIALAVKVVLFFIIAHKAAQEWRIELSKRRAAMFITLAIILVAFLDPINQLLNEQFLARMILYLYSILSASFILVLELLLVSTDRLKYDLKKVNYLWETDKKRYELSNSFAEMVNNKYHDLKHILRRVADKGSGEIEGELEEISSAFNLIKSTGSKALDAVLTEKSLQCGNSGIRLDFMCDLSSPLPLQEMEIYSLFGNLLDNAIEAQGNVDPGSRAVSLSISSKGDFILVNVQNFYKGELTFREGLPQTTKGDGYYHGYGLKSVSALVKKHEGKMKIRAENGIFSVDIVLCRST